MNTISLDNKKVSAPYQLTGFLFFGSLIFMAIYFFKEREFLVDKAFYDFRLLESGGFSNNIDLGRYSDIIGLILPWIALKMGLSLKAILISDSVGLILFHYAIFLFITLKLKNNGAGLAAMLATALACTRSFYTPQVGVNEVLVLGVLLWAFIHPEIQFSSDKQKRWATIGALLTVIVMTFYHPLSIFFILFVVGLEVTAFKRYRDSQLWIVVIVSIILFYLKFKVFFVNTYEQDKIVPMGTIFHELPGIKNWPITIYLCDLIKHHYRSSAVFFIICVLLSLRKGITFFLFTVLYIAGFTLIFLGSFYKGASSLLAYEAYFIIYGFFAALLFISLAYAPGRKNLILLISLPFLWIGIAKIYHYHEQFTYRVSYLSKTINEARKTGRKKCLVDSRCYPVNYADAAWAFAFESLLYSSLPGPDSSVTVFIKQPSFDSLCNANRNKKNILFGVYFSPYWFPSNVLPVKYLNLPSTGYVDLTTTQDDTSFHEKLFSSKNIKIIPGEQTIYANVKDWITVLPFKIKNTSGKVLPAIPRSKNPIQLSYTLYDKDGNRRYDNIPSAFETDIKDSACTGLIIYLPMDKGTYFARPDIITGSDKWWYVACPYITIIVD